MSRIRSIHPGLYTDEVFVTLSMAARVMLPGIWTECDDHGIFEWKPVTIKMKIFPADNVDVVALLDELIMADVVKKFAVDGKNFGIVRNFAKYQKPKNPSYRFSLPDEYRDYIGLKPETPPALPEDSSSPTENVSLMEGSRREVKKEDSSLRSEAAEKKPRRKPQVALPADWHPSDALRVFAKSLGLSGNETTREAERFRNHAAQTDRRCANWDAAFRNWCIKAVEHLGRTPPSNGAAAQVFIPLESPKWGGLAARWRDENRATTGPPAKDYPNGTGWFFPSEWVSAAA